MTVDERKELGLVGVEWEEDFGVVYLKAGKILMYGYGRVDHLYWGIPKVEIYDDEFLLLAEDREFKGWDKTKHPTRTDYLSHLEKTDWEHMSQNETADCELRDEYANWDNVCRLLLHPEFDFTHSVVMPKEEDEDRPPG